MELAILFFFFALALVNFAPNNNREESLNDLSEAASKAYKDLNGK